MFFRVFIAFLVAIAVAILFFRVSSSIEGANSVPLISVMCSSDEDVIRVMSDRLEHDGFVRDRDFRFTLYPCNAPNTPRQATTQAIGERAALIVLMHDDALAEALKSKIPVIDASTLDSKQVSAKIEDWLKARAARADAKPFGSGNR